MSTVVMNKKDEIIMKLVHYFVTEENYTPIIVNGVKDEIWLEIKTDHIESFVSIPTAFLMKNN